MAANSRALTYGDLHTMNLFDYRVLVSNPSENHEMIVVVKASTYAEALTMAERSHLGERYGIPAEQLARQLATSEGIAYNEADGLLIDGE